MTAKPPILQLAVAVVVACGFAGCGALTRDAVHTRWQDRPPLPACGEVSVSALEVLEEVGARGLRCLREGTRSGRGGELVVHYRTAEGDPITEYLRVTTERTAEVYTDSTQDEFSGQDWSYGRCDHPGRALDFVC